VPQDHQYHELTRENEKRAFQAEREGKLVVDNWPVKMCFEFTGACNLHCFMCGCEMIRDHLRERGVDKFTLPVDTFRMIAGEAFPRLSLVVPTLSGEPFVLPYWDELIDTVEKYGCKLDITTNGMLMKGDRLRRLMPHLANLVISFDGATKETFEYVRTGADFSVVMENLAEFAALRREMGLTDDVLTVSFNVTLLKDNIAELPQIIEIAAAHDIKLVTGAFMLVFDNSLRDSSPLNCPEITNRALAEARARAAALGVEARLPVPVPVPLNKDEQNKQKAVSEVAAAPPVETPAAQTAPEPQPGPEPMPESVPEAAPAEAGALEPLPLSANATDEPHLLTSGMPADWKGKYYCNFPWRTVFVHQQGEIAPCCSAGRPVFGNAYETDFMEIWNGPEYQRLREGLITGNLTDYCRNCTFLQEAGALDLETDAYVRDLAAENRES
jgi:MoaA/NifB/PqqE/SkfB family radical SAM enzyme